MAFIYAGMLPSWLLTSPVHTCSPKKLLGQHQPAIPPAAVPRAGSPCQCAPPAPTRWPEPAPWTAQGRRRARGSAAGHKKEGAKGEIGRHSAVCLNCPTTVDDISLQAHPDTALAPHLRGV